MTKGEIKTALGRIFATSKRDNGDEYIHFTSECMKPESADYSVYQAVSDAAYNSGLSHGFSYEILSRAAGILVESEDWDEIVEAVDAAVPIYTSELMAIYAHDAHAVDDAADELGQAKDTTAAASQAWYMLIERMTGALALRLEDLLADEG